MDQGRTSAFFFYPWVTLNKPKYIYFGLVWFKGLSKKFCKVLTYKIFFIKSILFEPFKILLDYLPIL
jgi:hypothetical protein